jgi:hypothetical protein
MEALGRDDLERRTAPTSPRRQRRRAGGEPEQQRVGGSLVDKQCRELASSVPGERVPTSLAQGGRATTSSSAAAQEGVQPSFAACLFPGIRHRRARLSLAIRAGAVRQRLLPVADTHVVAVAVTVAASLIAAVKHWSRAVARSPRLPTGVLGVGGRYGGDVSLGACACHPMPRVRPVPRSQDGVAVLGSRG